MRAAIYARVSTDRQQQNQTIDSQLAALEHWVRQRGGELPPEHIFKDEGYSGSRLDRPGLDALRDAAHDAAFDTVVVLCPDRLARKYAYQVLLLEELRRTGCEVVFLQHPISEDPNDQLLLQIQGAIAEYERAVLGERFRRGKLQKARDGHYLATKPPYGYRYVPKREGAPGHLVVDEAEAEVVRAVYGWLIEERMTVRQILKRLNFGPWFPRSGRRPWSNSVVHHIVSDPVYTGTAYANRYRHVAPKKPRRRGPRTAERSCRQLKPKEERISSSISRPIASARETPRILRHKLISQIMPVLLLLRRPQHFADAEHQPPPVLLLDAQLLAARGREAVEARPPVVLRHPPLRLDPPPLLQSVERRVERPFFDSE